MDDEQIKKAVMDRVSDTKVRIIVIHKPTNESASMLVPLAEVHRAARYVVDSYPMPIGIERNIKDFVLVEVFDSGKTRVSSIAHD